MLIALSIVEGCAHSSRQNRARFSCSDEHEPRTRITITARLASEIYLSSLQSEFFSNLLGKKSRSAFLMGTAPLIKTESAEISNANLDLSTFNQPTNVAGSRWPISPTALGVGEANCETVLIHLTCSARNSSARPRTRFVVVALYPARELLSKPCSALG
jgi:hypothetical protein